VRGEPLVSAFWAGGFGLAGTHRDITNIYTKDFKTNF